MYGPEVLSGFPAEEVEQLDHISGGRKVGVLILGILIVHGEGFIDGTDGFEAEGLLEKVLCVLRDAFMGRCLLIGSLLSGKRKGPSDVGRAVCDCVFSGGPETTATIYNVYVWKG